MNQESPDESIFFRKHVYLTITRENKDTLVDIPNFICFHEYSDLDKRLYKGDVGKIECDNYTFHFRFHENVIFEKIA